jgi:hypothetical protein
VRFSGAPAKVTECNNPWNSPEGVIPFLKTDDDGKQRTIYSAHEIGMYLRSKVR